MFNWKRMALVAGLIAGSAYAQEAMLVRFDLTDSMKKFLKANAFDVTGVNYNTMEIEALLTPEELSQIQAQKANIKFSFPQNLLMAPEQEYKTGEEVSQFLTDIHNRYPDITELVSIGKSLEGRDIWAIKISDNARNDEVEPAILVNGMHHAREVMGPEITTDMVEYLTTKYGQDQNVTNWVNNHEIYVIPMFNVDGNNKVWTQDAMWRKNTRGHFGVDINRNYPTAWASCHGSSASEWAQDYHGTGPASEPETQAMMNFVASIKPVFDISYHSYSEIVIYPYGCDGKRTPAEQAVEEIGAEIAKKISYKPGTAWELLYSVDGGDIDWMYQEQQVIPYVIEVNSTSQGGFYPNYKKYRNKTVEQNRAGWMHLFERMEGPSLQGHVASRSDYSSVKIFKAGEAKEFQNYKINPDGSFYVILKAGSYDFSFEGTKTKKMTNVEISKKTVITL